MSVTRRHFLKTGLGGVSLAFLSTRLTASDLQAAASDRALVIVQLMGGNDTLNTFIPYSDLRYRSARPTLAIPEEKILPVDSQWGFHPAMKGLHELYQERKFAFIPNVGFPTLDRSHFRCEDVWHTASETPDPKLPGWIGRWADLYAPDRWSPFTTVGVSIVTPPGLRAQRVFPTGLVNLESFGVQGDPLDPAESGFFLTSLRHAYGLRRSDEVHETIRQRGEFAFAAMDLLENVPPPSPVIEYPTESPGVRTALADALRLAAQLIDGNQGAMVVWVKIDGFDTHRDQVNPPEGGGSATGFHAMLLRDVSESLTAFQRDLEYRRIADRVVVVGWSEFGRRVYANTLGTDHGKAGTAFVLGASVRGGAYGDPYDLGDLDEGDLKVKTDFRAIYATIIKDWFGHDPLPVLGAAYENLGFVERGVPRRRAAGR